MKNLAAQELAGEPLGFIRASMAVRTLAKSTTNSDAVVLRAQKIPVQRVPPFVLREVKVLDDAPELPGRFCSSRGSSGLYSVDNAEAPARCSNRVASSISWCCSPECAH